MRLRLPRRSAAALALAFLMGATAAVASSPPAPSTCRALSPSGIPVARLEASYRRLTGLRSDTPLVGSQPRRYGVCGATHYVFELFTVAPRAEKSLTQTQLVAQQDHSPVWRQKAGGPWVDEGLDSLCNLAPAALINLWKVGTPTCKGLSR